MIKRCLPYILFSFVLLTACRQSYRPPEIDEPFGYLVVDGFLNNSADTTFIRLSRTSKIQSGVRNREEKNAQMSVTDANGTILYAFSSIADGLYYVPGMSLNNGSTCRLKINTANGNEYVSDEIQIKTTPPIDSISWEKTGDGVKLYATTHDPNAATQYYRWDFTETWEYRSNFYSLLKYEDSTMLTRTFPAEQVYTCWQTRHSTELQLASSAKLSEDVIYKKQIQLIPDNSIELNIKYSILLRQYALTKEAFEYLQNLKKISEQMGSVFDAQPSELPSNIHCTNQPDALALGYITASTMETKRIFIDKVQVLPWQYNFPCYEYRNFPLDKDSLEHFFGTGVFYTPIEERRIMGILIGYVGGVSDCVDCRLRGGVTEKPAFWP
jgi:hypothetical protein